MKNQQRLEAWHKKKAGGYALIPGNSQVPWVPASKKRKMGRRKARRVKSPEVSPKVDKDSETNDSEDSYA